VNALVLGLVLAAALLHASWNAIAKKGGDPLIRVALMAGVSGLCGLPLVLLLEPPAPASWPMLVASALIHQAYFAFLVLSYRAGDLSLVYPIARGAAPPMVALGAWLVAGERLSFAGVAAVMLISAAIASLAVRRAAGDGGGRAVPYALCTAVCIALYTVVDGLGGRAAGHVLSYVGYLFVLEGIPLVLFTVVRRRGRLREALRSHGQSGAVAGVLAITAYGLVIWAMTVAPLSYVSALREISVVIAALIGTRMLAEPFGARRVAAAIAVVVGIVALQLSQPP
jgi:drug/metabolite transporter (DMT)-like permease